MNSPSSYAFTLAVSRALMALMQPLMGTRSTGVIRVYADTAQTVVIPQSAYCYPIIDGVQRPDLLFKTAANPADTAGWTATDAGVDITVMSNLGGAIYNLDANTEFVFDPFIEDLAPRPGLLTPRNAAAFTGGVNSSHFGTLADVALFEQLAGPAFHVDLMRSAVKKFPAVMLSWDSTEAADGSSTPMTTRATRAGSATQLYKLNFEIAIVVSRQDADATRRAEGLVILDSLMGLLIDRNAVDGESVSTPSGVQLRRAFRVSGGGEFYQKYYVYLMQISTETSVSKIDDRVFSDWVLTSLIVRKQQDPALPNQGDLTLVDVEIDMT